MPETRQLSLFDTDRGMSVSDAVESVRSEVETLAQQLWQKAEGRFGKLRRISVTTRDKEITIQDREPRGHFLSLMCE